MKALFVKSVCSLSFLLTVVACQQKAKHLSKIRAKTILIDSTIVPFASIDSLIAPYKKELQAEMQQVFCYAPKKLVKNDGNKQSSLGNLVADLCYQMANPIFKEKTGNSIDFTLFNQGGMRAIISPGKVTKEHAFKLMPFENQLVVVTLSGKKVLELLAYFINSKKAHPLSKQVELIIDKDEYSFKINGKSFDKNNTYHVLTSDYLQHGGDRMNFFKAPKKLTSLDYKFRTAIIDYFIKVDTLKAVIDNRVIIKS